jgi:hypothetical protein
MNKADTLHRRQWSDVRTLTRSVKDIEGAA